MTPAGWRRDVLTRDLHIWQRADGHKAASDDLLLAHFAAHAAPEARRCLDLGTGKGTVALLLSQRLPATRIVGVEAYPESHALALRNAGENGLGDRFDPRLGDLRDAAVLAGEPPFDLVTGAPPFMPVGSGVLPRDPQRAAGRFELRGGVEAYAEAAARNLAASPSARLVLLMDGDGGARAVRAVLGVGLALRARVDVLPRPGRAPTYQLVVAGRAEFVSETAPPAPEILTMRSAEGEGWSPEFGAVRSALRLPGAD